MQPSKILKFATKIPKFATKLCISFIWTFIFIAPVVAIGLAIAQNVLYIILVKIHYKNIENETNQNTSAKHEVSYILTIFVQFLNVVDHILITYGVYRFLYATYCSNQITESFCKGLWVKECCKLIALKCSPPNSERQDKCHFLNFINSLLYWMGILITFCITFPPPILLIVSIDNFPPYNESKNIGKASMVMHILSHCFNCCAQLAMITATIMVRGKWLQQKQRDNDIDMSLDRFIKKYIDDYNESGKFIAQIQEIFESWFVIKWIIYFVDITVHCTRIVKALSEGEDLSELQYIFVLIHLLYDLIAFITIYSCGALMNSYHKDYYTHLEEEQQTFFTANALDNVSLNSLLKVMKCTKIVPLNPKYNFTPSFCGVDIPMDNSGYTLTVLLALFAFIFTFVTNLGNYTF